VKDKVDDFNLVLRRKLSSFEYDFRGVYFPAKVSFKGMNFVSDADFSLATFSADADFNSATFSAHADFMKATFIAHADFMKATFSAASFREVKFNAKVDFSPTTFTGPVYFNLSTFEKVADFRSSEFFDDAYFTTALFKNYAIFNHVTFSTDADFRFVMFSGITEFWPVTFGGKADFKSARFGDHASFNSSTFSNITDFRAVTFNHAVDFISTTFSAATDFSGTTFSGEVDFVKAKIESYLHFFGSGEHPVFTETASLKLELAQIAEPEQLIFHTVRLHPHWFVNVDARKFEFTNVNWVGFEQANLPWKERARLKLKRALTAWPDYLKLGIGSEALHNELRAMSSVENHHRLLSIACRQLATNAEDNNRYGDAAQFRYASMDARRLEKWRGWDIFTMDWWYWLVSGYGERIPRAMICLLVLLLSFGYLFTWVGFETKAAPEAAAIVQEITPTPAPLKELPLPSFRDGLTYAMSAALFQRPEPKAYTFWAKLCVSLEMVFVPLQAALLALAIRRRFMR